MLQKNVMTNILVLDLETEKEFGEVGGKGNMHLLGVTVAGVYNSQDDSFYAYEKEEFLRLEELLKKTSLLIGFNINHFDLPVLAPHVGMDLNTIPVLDLMEGVERALGFRIGLGNLSHATLGVGKSGVGLDAITWWRAGEKQKVKDYCLQDVRLTRDLYEFGKKNGFVFADTRDRGRVKLNVSWKDTAPSVKKILADGLEARRTVEIVYRADNPHAPRERRKIDVVKLAADSFEAFCHTRQGKRVFMLDRVEGASLTDELYQLTRDVQPSLI
jgi:hypothetical protein